MTVTAAAETYLLITRLTSRDLDTCQDWLATTWAHLARERRTGIPGRFNNCLHVL
jgi:hypothetical protein